MTPLYITDTFCTNIQQKLNDFVWDMKTPKISNEILQQNISEGGLRMPNVRDQILSQKLRYVKYWDEKHLWTRIANEQYDTTGDTLLRTKLETYSESCLATNQILEHWYKIQNISQEGKINLQDSLHKHQINRVANTKQKPVQIKTLNDVLHADNTQILDNFSFQVQATRTNLLEQIRTRGMVNYSPLHIKRGKKIVHVTRCTTRDLYWLVQPSRAPKSIIKWEHKYTRFKWRDTYKHINYLTNHYKTHKMQYYILHRCLNTRHNLYKWKKASSSLCILCNTEEESTEHLFFDCVKNNNFLSDVCKVLKHDNCTCVSRRNILLHENIKCLEIQKTLLKAKYFLYCKRLSHDVQNISAQNFFLNDKYDVHKVAEIVRK